MVGMKEILYGDDGDITFEEEVYELFQRVVETEGEFLWPKQTRADGKKFGFDDKELARIKAKYIDTTQFYAQYYNNPNSEDTARINSDKFQYFDKAILQNKEEIGILEIGSLIFMLLLTLLSLFVKRLTILP
jgi:hypothetical protein